ncbi:peroxiredoxin-1-like, partial [Artemia franciscana]|uniref:peroxiredoxin-1-like n=1 Tax=Artemia franciscana TaxID=6661 RepID=UPI0032DA8C7A
MDPSPCLDKVEIKWLSWLPYWLGDWQVLKELQKLQRTSFSGVKEESARIIAEYYPQKATMYNIVPAIGKPAPQFKGMAVVNREFEQLSLAYYGEKGKYVVFFFYPLDFTSVSSTEIIAFSDRVKEFHDIGVEVIGCSTDSHHSHLKWINTPRKQGGLGNINIPLLADENCSIAKSYGVYLEEEDVTFRGLFIIDPKQNLRQVTINDHPVGRSIDEILRLVRAFQFTDKGGEDLSMGEQESDKFNFPLEEEKILDYWKEIKAFQECLNQSKNKPSYTYYDGPPFATGLPHYGHILAGTIKDVVTRYAHQNGYHVQRRFGWDCHGLPVVSKFHIMYSVLS